MKAIAKIPEKHDEMKQVSASDDKTTNDEASTNQKKEENELICLDSGALSGGDEKFDGFTLDDINGKYNKYEGGFFKSPAIIYNCPYPPSMKCSSILLNLSR